MLNAAMTRQLPQDMDVDFPPAASAVPIERSGTKRKQESIEKDDGLSSMQEEEPRLPSFEEISVLPSTQGDAPDTRNIKRPRFSDVAVPPANKPPLQKRRSSSKKTNKKKNKKTRNRNKKAAPAAAQTARSDGDQQPASGPLHDLVNEQPPTAPSRSKRKLESPPQMDGALPPVQEDMFTFKDNVVHATVPLEAAPDASNTASANKRARRLSDGNVAEPVTHEEPLVSSDEENSAPVPLQAAPAVRPPTTLRRSLRILARRVAERAASKEPRPEELPASEKEASAASSDQTACFNREEQPASHHVQDLGDSYEQSPVCPPSLEHSEDSTDNEAPIAPPSPAKLEEAELLDESVHADAVPTSQEGQCQPAEVPQECSSTAEDEAEIRRLQANYMSENNEFRKKMATLLVEVNDEERHAKKEQLRKQLMSLREIAKTHGLLGVSEDTGGCCCPLAFCRSRDACVSTACGGCCYEPDATEEEPPADDSVEASVEEEEEEVEDINKLGREEVAEEGALSELEKLRNDIEEKLKTNRGVLQTLQTSKHDSIYELFQFHDWISALLQLLGEYGLTHLAGLSPAELEVEATFAHWYAKQQPADLAQPTVSAVINVIQEDQTTEVESQ